jgi:hypothetical protein
MSIIGRDPRQHARAQALQLVEAMSAAETVIVTTVERECEALRAGQMLAANALHLRLCDAARVYLNAAKSIRSSLWTIERIVPDLRELLEERRAAFAPVLKVELAVLAAERRDAGQRVDRPAYASAEPMQDATAGSRPGQGQGKVHAQRPLWRAGIRSRPARRMAQ